MGFKDGTMNPPMSDPAAMDEFVWAGSEGPAWMNGGTYTVVRRIRITLEHWDNTGSASRSRWLAVTSTARACRKHEFEALDLDAADKRRQPGDPRQRARASRIAAVEQRRADPAPRVLYNDSTNFYIERWPPWRQQTEYDAG